MHVGKYMEITIETILIDNVIVRTREFRSVGKHIY